MHVRFVLAALVTLALVTPLPASADLGIGLGLGGQIPSQGESRDAGGDFQPHASASVDVIKPPIVPLRGSIDFDYASGSRNAGKLDVAGLGAGVRLTTPLYAGLELGLYDVNARPDNAALASHSAVGAGTDLFAGTRILPFPGGGGLGLQFDYRVLPSAGGIPASNVGAGLRVQL